MKDLRIGVVVCNARVGATQRNLDNMSAWVEQARSAGAAIVCFPEMNITGYSNHDNMRTLAETIPGPASDKLCALSASSGCAILAGLAAKGGHQQIYATHIVAKPDGDLDVYRKCHIAPPEKEMYTPGNAVPVFQHQQTTFGIQLCYDTHFPELSSQMALKGAEVLFLPHASPRGLAVQKHRSWMRHLTARAFDNSVFVVACNQTGSNGKGLTFPGNAVVLDPAGNIIAQSLTSRETLLMVDLKADILDSIRSNRMHYFLPNRRPDLYGNGQTD